MKTPKFLQRTMRTSEATQTDIDIDDVPRIRVEPIQMSTPSGSRQPGRTDRPLPSLPANASTFPQHTTRREGTSRYQPTTPTAPLARSQPSTGPTMDLMSTSKPTNDASLTDMLLKAKEFGLPFIVVNVTTNCSTPTSTPAKVDIALPETPSQPQVLVNETKPDGQEESSFLGYTPGQGAPSQLFGGTPYPNTPGSQFRPMVFGDGAMGENGDDEDCRRPTSPHPTVSLPSVSSLSWDGDEERRHFDDDDEEYQMPNHIRQLIKSTDELMVKAASVAVTAMQAHEIPQDRTAFMKTCNSISVRLQVLGRTLNRRDADQEEEHKRLRTDWYIDFIRKLGSLERTLNGLTESSLVIIDRMDSTRHPNSPPTLSTFERFNGKLKEYRNKLENLNSRFNSALDKMEISLLRPQLEDAKEKKAEARFEVHEVHEKYHDAKIHYARLQQKMDTLKRRSGRRNSLIS